MEKTVATGLNRTGQDISPASKDDMVRYARAQGSREPPLTEALADLRRRYTMEADRLGSVPAPMRLQGASTVMADTLRGHRTALLVDKLGERLAFERSAVRMYEALLVKAQVARGGALIDRHKLARFRDDEESHFHLVAGCLVSLGVDPTAVTPCADTVGVAVSGHLQVMTDPRTTVAQALDSLLMLEMGDNASWDLLIELARESGHADLADSFAAAVDTERQHLEMVRAWLYDAVIEQAA